MKQDLDHTFKLSKRSLSDSKLKIDLKDSSPLDDTKQQAEPVHPYSSKMIDLINQFKNGEQETGQNHVAQMLKEESITTKQTEITEKPPLPVTLSGSSLK